MEGSGQTKKARKQSNGWSARHRRKGLSLQIAQLLAVLTNPTIAFMPAPTCHHKRELLL
jgi:hypothetical protein